MDFGCFRSFSRVFQLSQDDGRVVLNKAPIFGSDRNRPPARFRLDYTNFIEYKQKD